MKRMARCWTTVAALLALVPMPGCQGVRAVWPPAESVAKLTAAPTTLSFGNVQIGTSQTQSDALTSAAAAAPKITPSSVRGAGFDTDGVSLSLPPSLGRSTAVTVQNIGGLNATISQVTVAGKGFTISGISTPWTLRPGQSVYST